MNKVVVLTIMLTVIACQPRPKQEVKISCSSSKLTMEIEGQQDEVEGLHCHGPQSEFFVTMDGQIIPL